MKYKLTIDVQLMNMEPAVTGMDVLKRWQTEGKIELVEAEPPRVEKEPAYNWPGAPPKPREENRGFRGSPRARVKKEAPGEVNFKGVAAVLFPYKDSQKLNMGEINDVAHLVRHHNSKNELFVTANVKDFIADRKRERLKTSFGIVAMTPEEAVQMLGSIEGWK